MCVYSSYVESVSLQCAEFYAGSFPLSTRGRKEPGDIGGFKPYIDFWRLRQGTSNQMVERNHVDV